MQDLTSAMGILKSSFYDTFSSKHDLFLSCLDLYSESNMKWAWNVLEKTNSAREAISTIFQLVIDVVIIDGDRRGCFLGNCAVEVGQRDKDVAKRVSDGFNHFSDAFAIVLQRGLDSGELTSVENSRSTARYLVSSLNGLRIAAMASPDRHHLEGIVKIVMSIVR